MTKFFLKPFPYSFRFFSRISIFVSLVVFTLLNVNIAFARIMEGSNSTAETIEENNSRELNNFTFVTNQDKQQGENYVTFNSKLLMILIQACGKVE